MYSLSLTSPSLRSYLNFHSVLRPHFRPSPGAPLKNILRKNNQHIKFEMRAHFLSIIQITKFIFPLIFAVNKAEIM